MSGEKIEKIIHMPELKNGPGFTQHKNQTVENNPQKILVLLLNITSTVICTSSTTTSTTTYNL